MASEAANSEMISSSLRLQSVDIYVVNAFVEDKSRAIEQGNPAAVVLLLASQDAALSDSQMQIVAAQMNLSETVFVMSSDRINDQGERIYKIRWFTPTHEVALCGHATLAAAETMFHTGVAERSQRILMENNDGYLISVTSEQEGDGDPNSNKSRVTMSFPSLTQKESVSDEEQNLIEKGLGITEYEEMFRSKYDVLVRLSSAKAVEELQPNYDIMAKVETRGIIVCAAGGPQMSCDDKTVRFCSRFFAPRMGVKEDPVTGSAHCVLAPLFLEAGESGLAVQLSKRRGLIFVFRRDTETVMIGGMCGVVLRGNLQL